MAQGTRGRWVRSAATGLGVLLCTGLVGCMNTGKDKKDKLVTKQPTPGLPGTPKIESNGPAFSRTGTPVNQFGTGGSGIQQTGGFASPRAGSSGLNTNTSPPQTFGNSPVQPGNPGAIGAPAYPGFVPSVQPAPSNFSPTDGSGAPGGFGSAAPNSKDPLASAGIDMPLPPPPPGTLTASGAQPPVHPPTNLGPIPPPIAPPVQPTALSGKSPW